MITPYIEQTDIIGGEPIHAAQGLTLRQLYIIATALKLLREKLSENPTQDKAPYIRDSEQLRRIFSFEHSTLAEA